MPSFRGLCYSVFVIQEVYSQKQFFSLTIKKKCLCSFGIFTAWGNLALCPAICELLQWLRPSSVSFSVRKREREGEREARDRSGRPALSQRRPAPAHPDPGPGPEQCPGQGGQAGGGGKHKPVQLNIMQCIAQHLDTALRLPTKFTDSLWSIAHSSHLAQLFFNIVVWSVAWLTLNTAEANTE